MASQKIQLNYKGKDLGAGLIIVYGSVNGFVNHSGIVMGGYPWNG